MEGAMTMDITNLEAELSGWELFCQAQRLSDLFQRDARRYDGGDEE